jgi:FAD/FMN-containing dehydrogenase
VNQTSLRVFNACYYHAHMEERERKTVEYEGFFYPLDSILHWNRIYGVKGFQQYQCVIPAAHAEAAIKELLQIISRSGTGSFLAVLKRCGSHTSPGLLSFPLEGTSLALDFPQKENLSELFKILDQVVRNAQGRLYPAKDAHMSATDFQKFYPAWSQLKSLQDPALTSHFWERVTS